MRLMSTGLFVAFLAAAITATGNAADTDADAAKTFRRYATNIQFNKKTGRAWLIRISKPHVTDADMAQVKQFSQLQYLAVVTPRITDAGIANVANLGSLETLLLSGSGITDKGLGYLRNLQKLERLYLANTKITDAGLKHLAGLTSLKSLNLEGTAVSDAGLKHLAGLQNLEYLVLAKTKVSDTGLKQLAALKNIKLLDLSGCRIRGNGLAVLKPLKKLQYLLLTDTQVTDATVSQLSSLQTLKQVELYRAPVTASGVKKLRAALPKTGIASSIRPEQKRLDDETLFGKGAVLRKADLKPILAPIHTRFAANETLTPDFQRHVIPLLGRLGCNGRSCHGSFQGQGGFRLSMFGYDFDMDHKNLTARIDRKSPRKSLILNKPTSADEHGGGLRLPPGKWQQELLRRWIAGGAKNIGKDAPTFVRLEIEPREIVFHKAGETRQLRAVAVWSNGLREDVTPLTRFDTKDDGIAEVTPDGLVRARGKGDTHILSFYDNGIIATPVIRPVTDQVGSRYPQVATPTKIDELVVAKLRKLGIRPSEVCTDEEFLRRVSLDLIGTLPTPKEIREFTADKRPDKRAKKVDELLERPEYVTWWTMRLCDLTGSNAGYLGNTQMAQPVASQWRSWIERRVKDNDGWDDIVEGIVLARSRRDGQPYREFIAEQSEYTRRKDPADFAAPGNPMPHFWFRDNISQPKDKALAFGYTFLGVRLNCAQCHKHPFDQWSKQDFEMFTQFFTRIKAGLAPDAQPQHEEMRAMLGVPSLLNTAATRRQSYLRIASEGRPIPWREIYIEAPKGKSQPAKLLGGNKIDLSEFEDPRVPLMEWLRREPNHYLARAFVNRIWANYFHVGIVSPPDDLNLANPPSNGPLLDHLVAGFIKSGYDMKWLHRTIITSRTYQRSWRPNETNGKDERNFSRAVLRRLPAEVAVDAMIQATAGTRAMAGSARQLAARKIAQHPRSYQARAIDFSLLIFGKSLRTTNCDCERQGDPTLLQALYVRNDQEMIDRLDRPDGWLAELKKKKPAAKDADALIREAYLRVLSREPEPQELEDCRKHLVGSPTIVDGLRDLLWALLNTQEFITNH